MLYPSGIPATGHSWMTPLEQFLVFLLADCTGGLNFIAFDLYAALALPANSYANGTAGVGATLTGSSNGALTVDGVAVTKGLLVLVNGEASPANNGLYTVTQPGSASTPYILTRFAGISGANAVPAFNSAATIVPGTIFGCRQGSAANKFKTFTYPGPAAPTVGTTALSFAASPKPALFRGVIAAARLVFTVQPTATNTVVLGGQTFTFVSSLGAATSSVQVLIGAAAANTLTNLVNAINNDSASKGSTWVEATTPATIAVRAFKQPSTSLCIKNATARGGVPVSGPGPSFALSTTIAGGAAWSVSNLNVVGKLDTDSQESSGSQTVSAAMITVGYLDIDLPFVPTTFSVDCFSSGGVKRAYSDVTTVVNNGDGSSALHIVLGGGASPNLQANDVLSFWAQQ